MRRSRAPLWLYFTFFAGWVFASVLIVRGAIAAEGGSGDVAPAWFFVAGTGVLVAALVDRDMRARREARALLEQRQALIESMGVVTDPRLSQMPLYQLLDELLVRVRTVLKADTASIFLFDREGASLELSASSGLGAGSPKVTSVPIGQGVLGRLATGRRGMALADAPADAGVPPGTASLVGAPLVAEGLLVGVLQAGTRQRHQFNDEDVRLLQVVADRAAVAIDSSRLEREAQRATLAAEGARQRLAMLADAGEVLARSFDHIEEMTGEIGGALVSAFVDWFAYYEVDADGGARLVTCRAGGEVNTRSDGGGDWQAALDATRADGPSLTWGDALANEAAFRPARALGLTSVVLTPVVLRDEMIGAMAFGTSGRRRGLRSGDVATCHDLAARVAVAIERVQLGAETKESAVRAARRAAQLQRLTEGAFAINAALATQTLARVVAEQAARVLDADGAWMGLRQERAGVLRGKRSERDTLPATAHRARALVTDAAGTAIGSVAVARVNAPFSAEEEAILGSLAQIASVASVNAQLYGSVEDSEARLRALYDASPVAIVELDDAGRAVRWNRAAETMFGWPPYGADVGSVMVPQQAVGVVTAALADDVVTSADVTLGEDGNQIDVEVVAVPLRERGRAEPGAVLAAVDVTERKQVAEQLQQAHRMEAMARMAGGIAHDFNNVLMVITGYADLLLKRPVDDDVRRDVEGMRAAAARAAAFTRKLLTISRRQMVQFQVVDVDGALRSLQEVMALMVGANVELAVDVADPPSVLIDPAQFEQLVLNLVINARDAMPHGGTITLTARRAIEDATWAVVEVADTGEGMDAVTLEHCFEPFFTTKDRTKGTGLGLSTVYGVVTQAGGEIAVDSRPGEGTRFTIRLPAADDVAEELLHRPPITAGGALRILVVDDEPEVRAIVGDMLELEGHTVVVAPDGDAALPMAEELEPDIVLTDVVMPGMNGPELARRILERYPAARIVFMSAHVDDPVAITEGIDGASFLAKPFSGDALLEVVAAVSGGTSVAR